MAEKTPLEKLQDSSMALSGDSLTSAIQFNGQCFLIQNMLSISSRRRLGGSTPGLAPSSFKYISPIFSSSTYKPEQVYSKVTATKSSNAIADFTPAQMAMLVPKIRIYKLVYKAKADGDTLRINRDIEPDSQEILFDDFTRTSQLDDILAHRGGRASGIGIKSFKWSLKGVNPAEVDANITAELVIHFNDVSQLTRKAAGGEASFLDLILYNPSKLDKKDFPDNKIPAGNVFHYDGQFFEIQAVVGWAVPPGSHNDLFDAGALEAIRESQTPLFLQLTKHQFDFSQDGSADLKINYRARLSDQESGYDILNVPGDHLERVKVLQKDLKELKETTGDDSAATKVTQEELDQAQKQLNESLGGRYSRLLNVLKVGHDLSGGNWHMPLGAADRKRTARHIYNAWATPLQLRAVDIPEGSHPRGHEVSSAEALKSALLGATAEGAAFSAASLRSGTAQTSIARGAADSDNWALAFLNGKLPPNTWDSTCRVTKRRTRMPMADITALQDDESAQAKELRSYRTTDMGENTTAIAKSSAPVGVAKSLSSNEIAVPFVYVGDIIDAAIHILNIDAADGNGRIKKILVSRDFGLLMGDFRFYNIKNFYATVKNRSTATEIEPLTFLKNLQIGEMSWTKEELESMFISINTAHIPIQWDSFLDWYLRKVVKAKRQRYFFSHFVRDLFTDLVAPALSARCFYGIPQHNVQVSMLDFPVAKNSQLASICYPGDAKSWKGPQALSADSGTQTVNIDYLEKIRAVPATINADDTVAGHTMMRYIHLNSIRLNYMEGDYKTNIDSGIQHFVVGLDRGLLKEARFERVDAPYLREARVNRNRTLGTQHLRELYNVSLKLYGTPILKPGQYIYVSPSTFGFGDLTAKDSHARMLGIGGYHLVVSVESTIGRNGYETTVKALHQALPAIYKKPPGG